MHDVFSATYGWATDPSLNLARLVENGTMDAASAGLLWLCAAHRLSFLVAGGPRQIGKTTLAAAYRDALPPDMQLVYTKGMWEDFAWVGRTEPERTAVLVAEFSDHTPVYLNGEAARHVFDLAARDRYRILGALHATSPGEALEVLTEPPLEVAPALLGTIDVVAALTVRVVYDRTPSGLRSPRGYQRRLGEIAVVAPRDGEMPDTLPLVTYDVATDSYSASPTAASRTALARKLDMDPARVGEAWERRREALSALVKQGTLDTPSVRTVLTDPGYRS